MIYNDLQPITITIYNQLQSITRWFIMIYNDLQPIAIITINYIDLYDDLHPFTTAITINYNYFCDIYNRFDNQ